MWRAIHWLCATKSVTTDVWGGVRRPSATSADIAVAGVGETPGRRVVARAIAGGEKEDALHGGLMVTSRAAGGNPERWAALRLASEPHAASRSSDTAGHACSLRQPRAIVVRERKGVTASRLREAPGIGSLPRGEGPGPSAGRR